MTRRFAIYLAPPAGSPLERFARGWLGRDHVTGATVTPEPVAGIAAERQQAITASPRHYGFHATLKAPFELADGTLPEQPHQVARAFAAARPAFTAGRLAVRSVDGFMALVPETPCPRLDTLAADCVRAFDGFRREPSQAEIVRRRRSRLTPRQDAHLLQWGYPYVLDDFRFHMTLTERLAQPEHDQIQACLTEALQAILATPLAVHDIAIYEQPDRDSPFHLTGRYPLARG